MAEGGQARPERARGANTVTPITIRQLHAATPDPNIPTQAIIDHKPISHVTLVCFVINTNPENTTITYKIDDATGVTDARQIIDDDARPTADYSNQYVRIFGNIRIDTQRAPTLMITRVAPITDFNEVTFHMLEALHTHLRATRGPRAPAPLGTIPGTHATTAAAAGAAGVGAAPGYPPPAYGAPVSAHAPAGFAAPPMGVPLTAAGLAPQAMGAGAVDGNSPAFPEALRAAMGRLEATHSGGVPLRVLCREFPNVPQEMVVAVCQRLVEEGNIYTTLDEETFLLT